MGLTALQSILASVLRGNSKAGLSRVRDESPWGTLSASELCSRVRSLGAALTVYGLERSQRVAIICGDGIEGVIAELAVASCGGVAVSIDPTFSDEAFLHSLKSTQSKHALVSDEEKLSRLLAVRPELPALDLVLLFRGPKTQRALPATLVEAACSVGERALAREPDLLERASLESRAQDLAILFFDARGSRSIPDAIHVSHGSLAQAVQSLASLLALGPADVVLSLLPPLEPFRRVAVLACLAQGASVIFAAPGDLHRGILTKVRPTVVLLGREETEGLRLALLDEATGRSWVSGKLFRWALEQGRRRAQVELSSGSLPRQRPWSFRVAEKLVLASYPRRAGGRLRFLVSVGEPLPVESTTFLFSVGLPILEAWGPAETSGVLAINTPNALRLGTAGRPVPGAEVRIDESMVILVRGSLVGVGAPGDWLHTGHYGRVDEQGYLVLAEEWPPSRPTT